MNNLTSLKLLVLLYIHDFLIKKKKSYKKLYIHTTPNVWRIIFVSYHEGFKKWVEVGNSGMFRPEMLLPMGLPEDVRVIAWGLSLER